MNWKKNPNVVIGLLAALAVAVLVILVLWFTRSSSSSYESGRKASPAPQRPGPPHQRPQLQRPPQRPPRHHPPQRHPPGSPVEHQTPVGGPPPSPGMPRGKPAMVLFHANWCGNCLQMKPSWDQAKMTLAQGGDIDIIDLEHKQYPEEMKKHGIAGFPTVRYYAGGFPSANYAEYRGNRTTESLINFARSAGQQS